MGGDAIRGHFSDGITAAIADKKIIFLVDRGRPPGW